MSKRRRRSGAEVEVWKPIHDVPLIIENTTGTSLSVTVFMRNEAAARSEDEYIGWKVFNLSSPGSANLIYPKESAVGVICMEVQGLMLPPNTTNTTAAVETGADVVPVDGNATRPTVQVRATVAVKRGSSSISQTEQTESSSSQSAGEAETEGEADENGAAVAVAGSAAVKVGVGEIQTAGPIPCKDGSTYMFLPPVAGRVKCDLERGKFQP